MANSFTLAAHLERSRLHSTGNQDSVSYKNKREVSYQDSINIFLRFSTLDGGKRKEDSFLKRTKQTPDNICHKPMQSGSLIVDMWCRPQCGPTRGVIKTKEGRCTLVLIQMQVMDSGWRESPAHTEYGKGEIERVRRWTRYLGLTSYEPS